MNAFNESASHSNISWFDNMYFFIVIFIVWLCYKYLIKSHLYWKRKNVKQGIPVPLFGNGFKAMFKQESVVEMVWNSYKCFAKSRYSGIYQMTTPTLIIRDPELIKQITIKDFDHFVDHMSFPFADEPLWRKNLVFLKGEEWKKTRDILSPTFTSSKIRMMFDLIEQTATQFVEFYLKENEDIIELELKDVFTKVATDIIANCGFGVKVDSLNNPLNEFYINGKDITNFSTFSKGVRLIMKIALPTLSKYLNIQVFSPKILNFFKLIVQDSIRVRQEKNIQRQDMINILMEAQRELKFSEMAEEEMAAQVLIFFFAGFETISIVLTFTCYELAINPDVQEKLREEVDQVNMATNYKPTYEVIMDMKYLDMVISEGLRKNPPAVFIDRICTKPYTIQPKFEDESPLTINIGDILWIPIIGLHHDEKYFPQPEKFIPERFSDENKANIKGYTFLPFGTGPRNCIGSRFALLEVKVLLYKILTHFELIPIGKTKIPMKYDIYQFNPGFEGGCWLGLQRRTNNKR